MFRRHVGMTPAVFRHKVHGLSQASGGGGNPPILNYRAQTSPPSGV
jgi:hypothetical protein